MLGTTASRSLRYLLIATGITTAGALGAYAYTATPRPVASVPFAPPRIIEPTIEQISVMAVTAEATPSLAHASDIKLVFSAGHGSYMKLQSLDENEQLPKHGKAKLDSEDGIESAIAPVAAADVPASYRAWLGRTVLVDNRCESQVTGFAIVVRLTGSPDYAGEEGDAEWTATNVIENGSAVLAARIGCSGTFARDAALAPYVTPEEITDTALGAKAKANLLASAVARQTQKEWREAEAAGTWTDHAFEDIKVLRHPTTGVIWVSVHIWQEMACGSAEANVWGLFRLADDGSLVPSQMRQLSDGMGIEQLIDVEGDGELEVVGRPWLGVERQIEHADGDEIDALSLPFFGCPC